MKTLFRNPLFILLFAYLVQLFGFAIAYQNIHSKDRTSFVFNSAISEKQLSIDNDQIHISNTKLEQEVLISNEQIRAILTAKIFPSRIRTLNVCPVQNNPSNSGLVLNFEEDGIHLKISSTLGRLKESVELLVTNRNLPNWKGYRVVSEANLPDILFDEDSQIRESSEGCAQLVEIFNRDIEEDITQLQKNVVQLNSQRLQPVAHDPSWNFTEYLYFSVIVLGGGSGDIIPNSRTVRRCVIVQYLVSILIIVFAINAFSQKASRIRPNTSDCANSG